MTTNRFVVFPVGQEVNGWYYLLDEKLGQEKHLHVGLKVNTEGTPGDSSMVRPNSILPWISLHSVSHSLGNQEKL